VEEIAAVYARSLFEVAREQGTLDEVREQLGQIADAFDANRQLTTFFFSPYFSTQEKEKGLESLLDGAEPAVMNFLKLLIENHRTPFLFRVRREYDTLWQEEHRLLPVEITSAIELDPDTIQRIGEQIGEASNRAVQVTATVDPDVLGGLVVRAGNSILDASIRNRLEQLRKQVATAQ
jgi:F-type H+-transporting ATPase subunit delta